MSGEFLSRKLTADEEERVAALHERAVVVDTLGALHADDDFIEGMRRGGVNAVGLTLAIESGDFRQTMEKIVYWNTEIRRRSRDLVLAESAAQIRAAKSERRIAVIYLFQNGRPFADEPGFVEVFRKLGVTSSQLTYELQNFLGSGCAEAQDGGLSRTGEQIVKALNDCGMLVDISHAGDRTARDVLDVSRSPVYVSHGGCRSLIDTKRFFDDETIRRIGKSGGMISATGLYQPVTQGRYPTIANVIDQTMMLIDLLGPENVGMSTDFLKEKDWVYRNGYVDKDGYLTLWYPGALKPVRWKWEGNDKPPEYPWHRYPRGLEKYADYRNVTRELVARRLSDEHIVGILGGNYLRLYEKVVG